MCDGACAARQAAEGASSVLRQQRGVQGEGQAKVDGWVEETEMDVEGNVVVVKSAEGGSSIGVKFSQGLPDALEAARQLLLGGSPMVRPGCGLLPMQPCMAHCL